MACLGITIYHFLPYRTKFRIPYLPGVAILLFAFLTGYFLSHSYDIRNNRHWLGNQVFTRFNGIIHTEPVRGAYYTSFTIRTQSISTGNIQHVATGFILVKAKLSADLFNKGDLMAIHKRPMLLVDTNPKRSGYINHLNRKNIRHQVIVGSDDIVDLQQNHSIDPIISLRKSILNRINRHVKGKNENALAKALLVGERADLDKDLSQAYADTGVIHVIAISGMHLSLIYSIFAIALGPMDRLKRLRWLKTIIIIISLWIFSFLCGASASVLRSAVMFSFLLVGQCLEKDNNPINTLGASAFLLLSTEPVLLYDIGFQLSYAAVGSLLVFNRLVSAWYTPDNKLIAMGWNTISTSISAQILTTPLVLFHFHQFPLLFILSNLVAVPLSGVILILLIAICLLDPFTTLASLLGNAAALLIRIMNERIVMLGSIPFGKWENINIAWYEVVNIYLLILLLTFWLRSKK
jgi:competence protein ComEC